MSVEQKLPESHWTSIRVRQGRLAELTARRAAGQELDEQDAAMLDSATAPVSTPFDELENILKLISDPKACVARIGELKALITENKQASATAKKLTLQLETSQQDLEERRHEHSTAVEKFSSESAAHNKSHTERMAAADERERQLQVREKAVGSAEYNVANAIKRIQNAAADVVPSTVPTPH